MRHWFALPFLVIILSSCEKKHDDGAVSMSIEKRDSLLLDYITKEFDFNFDSTYLERSKYNFRIQLNTLRKDTSSSYTHVAKFKSYHLKSFLFDSQRKSPFAIEITNDKAQFISFFTFTDEIFYKGNSVSVKNYMTRSVERDSILHQKINFEYNLNLLTNRLGINTKNEMLGFTEMLCGILNMPKISEDSIRKEIRLFYFDSERPLNDSIFNLVEKEQALFFQKGSGDILQVRTQDSLGIGYWRIWIEEINGKLTVRTGFFSDILFNPMYM
jgi:hypothetical protein